MNNLMQTAAIMVLVIIVVFFIIGLVKKSLSLIIVGVILTVGIYVMAPEQLSFMSDIISTVSEFVYTPFKDTDYSDELGVDPNKPANQWEAIEEDTNGN